MDFQRIDKNTVQCRMTEEEMNEYGFEVTDFFNDQEKSRAFLEQIVERAEEEIGYKSHGGMISMQLMMMPDNSLTITFSEKNEEDIHNMLNHIQNLANIMDENVMSKLGKRLLGDREDEEEVVDTESKAALSDEEQKKAYQKHIKEAQKAAKAKEKKQLASSKVYKFNSLSDLENFAAAVSFEKNIASKVYKDNVNGDFYLLIKKGKLKIEEYQMLCQQLSEYAKLCSQQPFVEQYCKEHFECFISKNALKVLKY